MFLNVPPPIHPMYCKCFRRPVCIEPSIHGYALYEKSPVFLAMKITVLYCTVSKQPNVPGNAEYCTVSKEPKIPGYAEYCTVYVKSSIFPAMRSIALYLNYAEYCIVQYLKSSYSCPCRVLHCIYCNDLKTSVHAEHCTYI